MTLSDFQGRSPIASLLKCELFIQSYRSWQDRTKSVSRSLYDSCYSCILYIQYHVVQYAQFFIWQSITAITRMCRISSNRSPAASISTQPVFEARPVSKWYWIVITYCKPPQKGGTAPPQFSAHVHCGQTAGWIKKSRPLLVHGLIEAISYKAAYLLLNRTQSTEMDKLHTHSQKIWNRNGWKLVQNNLVQRN